MTRISVMCILMAAVLYSCSRPVSDSVSSDSETPLIANGISNQRISSFAEDEHGHIWIGTFRGLNRFNVHDFHQHFCTDAVNTLPDNQIQCLLKDSRDRLWISTVNGMALYTDRDDFKRIPMETASRNAIQILEDKSGRIFINTAVSLCVYDEEQGKFTNVLPVLDASPSLVRQCFVTPDNDILVATQFAIKRYDAGTMQMKDSLAVSGYPGCFSMMPDGELWMSSYTGISIYDSNKSSFVDTPDSFAGHPRFVGSDVSCIYPYGNNMVLISTSKGACSSMTGRMRRSGISRKKVFRSMSRMPG